ncbi:hypothetical protein SAMN04244573_02482 [Azotobacter beijerinckii]|uniref:Uncharacterized protein n=1 Tax=Azotobacter beijerinckii TaxID=170623 RepID=A0A1H9JTU8_9GAMM|nr:hypothetical protein [Azotobacter beijerinckii]SEQ90174.1 hypothetical protein SAMN04244573_02482 [Azotobacter beijerinckii]
MQDIDPGRRKQVARKRIPERTPHAALAWLQAGNSIGIDAVNAADWRRHIDALARLAKTGGTKSTMQREDVAA